MLDLDNVLVGWQKEFLKAGQIIIEQLKQYLVLENSSIILFNIDFSNFFYLNCTLCVLNCTLCAATRSCFSRSVFPSSALPSRSPRVCEGMSFEKTTMTFCHENIMKSHAFTLRLTSMLIFAPQEHLSAGVVAFMLKTAPSLQEEHLNWIH